MGLDVYLYRYDNYPDTAAREEAYERESNAIWERIGAERKYDDIPEADRERARAEAVAVAERLGLDKDGDDCTKEQIDQPSAKYPDHLFRVGYFRSSYNDSGIDRVLRARTGSSLGAILGYDGAYCFRPDWTTARSLTLSALADLRSANTVRPYRAMTVGPNVFGGDTVVDSEATALDVFDRVRREHASSASFGCRDGDFFLKDALPVRAAIMGRNSLGMPCVYLVYDDSAENLAWYEQALEIMVETIDYVLAQPRPEQFYLHWSS